MAKLLKIGSAVTEIEDIKIGTPEEIKEGTAKEAEPVSGEVDNSGNWTSITIGDTTGTIPAGSSGLEGRVTALEGKVGDKLDNVTKVETGLVFGENTYFGENVAVDGDLNMNGANINFNGATLGVEDDRVGQYVGEEEPEFKKFGYVEEVEFQGKGIGPGQAGVNVDTVVEEKLYIITISIAQIPAEYHFPTNITGTVLEIYSESQSNWYKPMWTYYDNETGYLKQFAFFFSCDPDGEDICKFKLLK